MVYAAVSKLLEYSTFSLQLGQSPLLSPFAHVVAPLTIAVEIIAALLLMMPKGRETGLQLTYALMVMFTFYIWTILHFSNDIPCACGGILEKMDWDAHLVFNFVFTVLGLFAIVLYQTGKNKTASTVPVQLDPKATVYTDASHAHLFGPFATTSSGSGCTSQPCTLLISPFYVKGQFIRGYKITSIIKDDEKGRVMRGVYLQGILPKQCIIKEGKTSVYLNQNGKETLSNLYKQFKLLASLHPSIPVPKPYDFFEDGGNEYLVMGYIKGVRLHEALKELYGDSTFGNLKVFKKKTLLGYLLDLATALDNLHIMGYIHRDVTASNILVRKGKIYLLDLELAWSINSDCPTAEGGTDGYVSPEQQRNERPTVSQECFSYGAIMLYTLTNTHPAKWKNKDSKVFFQGLESEGIPLHIILLMMSCLHNNPDQRPAFKVVQEQLQGYIEGFKMERTNKIFI